MQLPSVDVFIGLFFLFGVAYGLIFQREKIITTLCSVYVGIVVAENFSGTVFQFFNGNKVVANQLWIKSNASVATISIVLFLSTILLISAAISVRRRSDSTSSPFDSVLYSVLAVALILSSILTFLPEASRAHYLEISAVARYLFNFKTLLVILPPIVLVITGFRSKNPR